MESERKSKPILKKSARTVVYKVYKRCVFEYHAGRLLSDIKDVFKRTADLTGTSSSTVRRIVQNIIKSGGKSSAPPNANRKGRPAKTYNDFDTCAIRQKVFFFYTIRKEIPILRKLLPQIKGEFNYDGSREHLRKLLMKIGFQFKKCKLVVNSKVVGKQALLEKPMIAHKREQYLKVIMQNRNLPEALQKDVIFLDECYVHSSYKLKKCWQTVESDNVPGDLSKGRRWILALAGNEKGFVPNALSMFSGGKYYNSEISQDNFTKWVQESLIPNLSKPSIIVMDSAPYHCALINRAPTIADTIDHIRLWLLKYNIPFDPALRKPSLLALVKRYKPDPVYEIDQILGQYGHIVVRLPPFHCDLNPIELIWAMAKKKMVDNDAKDIKRLALDVFESITVEDWKNCCEIVKKNEKDYYEHGKTLYAAIDELIYQVDDSDDDLGSTEESEDEMEIVLPPCKKEDKMVEIDFLDIDQLP